jgi:hypothetical protein
MNRFAVVAMSLAVAFATATFAGSNGGSTAHKTAVTVSANVPRDPGIDAPFLLDGSIGTPSEGGNCAFTSGVSMTPTAVWTCYVLLELTETNTGTGAWVASWPTWCGWECKTTFTPSHGVVTSNGEWVKIQTTIGGCANYNLSFKTATGILRIPVTCG